MGKFRNFGLIALGAVAGVLVSLNFQAIADRTTRGPLPIEDVVQYVTAACDAVGEAHRMGIVHRDLKPSNLFLTTKPSGRVPNSSEDGVP